MSEANLVKGWGPTAVQAGRETATFPRLLRY